jgi:hypothetical protein
MTMWPAVSEREMNANHRVPVACRTPEVRPKNQWHRGNDHVHHPCGYITRLAGLVTYRHGW